MNGAVESANKNIKKILVKMIDTYKDWHEYLPFALCAYRTFVRTSMGATSYSLLYGMEVVLPAEVEISSLRILSQIDPGSLKKVRPRVFKEGDLVLKRRNQAVPDHRGIFTST